LPQVTDTKWGSSNRKKRSYSWDPTARSQSDRNAYLGIVCRSRSRDLALFGSHFYV